MEPTMLKYVIALLGAIVAGIIVDRLGGSAIVGVPVQVAIMLWWLEGHSH